jgi:hypothetical protein
MLHLNRILVNAELLFNGVLHILSDSNLVENTLKDKHQKFSLWYNPHCLNQVKADYPLTQQEEMKVLRTTSHLHNITSK